MALNLVQLQAVGIEEAGNAFAVYELSKSPNAGAALTSLANSLPLIPVGGVTAEGLGIINGQLEAAQVSVPSTNTQLLEQVGSLISLVSQSQTVASGGVVTVDQSILVGIATNAKVGILNAIAYAKGVAEGKAGAA